MEKNNAPNYDKIILNELENVNLNYLGLKEFNQQFLKKSVFEIEVENVNIKLREIINIKDNIKPVILLIFVNRLVNIAKKSIFLKTGKSLEENIFFPELELLANLIKEGNIIKDCFEYAGLSGLQDLSNSFIIEILNAIIKIPTLAINSVLALKPSLKNNMDIRILDKYIPMELHDSNYYKYIWLCVLHILNDIEPNNKAAYSALQIIFNRLFLRGYKNILCSIMIEWPIITDKFVFKDHKTLNSKELYLNRVFDNILNINKGDKNLIRSFVKQLFKEIENSRLEISEGVVILKLGDSDFDKEFNLEDIVNDNFFFLFRSIIDFCVLEEGLSDSKGFLKSEMFLIKKQSFSMGTYLVFLDICVLNIVKKEEFGIYILPQQHFDYLEKIRLEKFISIEKSGKSKVYLSFLKEITQFLAKQWNSYQESMTYSLTLSVVMVRAISILIYLNLDSLSSLKGMLLEFYMDITEGIQFRLKNIDPVIRSSAMYLGEFYFNLLYELFPSNNEADSGYLINEIPKFDELKLLNPEINNLLACIHNSTKFFVIKIFSNVFETQIRNVTESIKEMTLSQKEKELDENKAKDIVDEDDEFWNKAPSIKVTSKNARRIQSKVSKGQLSVPNTIQIKEEPKNKLVNKSFDLINLYTDEKKSKEIPDKAEKLLNLLKELAEDIEKDNSNYDHLISPLIDKLISLREKDQNILALIILSKLIQYKTDKVAANMIIYSCNMNNGIPMDTRILVLNSLISACKNMANSQSNTQSTIRPNKKVIINLFDKHSLIWSSHLVKYIMDLIIQSEDHEHFEKIPNIFFISSLELFNQIILNTSSNNTNIEQITYSGLEFVISIDLINNHLFKDLAIRKSIYLLTFNIILKCKYSSYCVALNQISSKILAWLSRAEVFETDPNSIKIIHEIKSFIS
ncbi:uncharacterized protein cubi_00850 [Cryptosporidium ubiquitum]|uniref:Uncharacterized protein n=1 Tax=Cryptosporidium ubiquitum TaxID=857276 RepID=A0A1J4MF63_9CRYT|nr:uncharacterized protein cubi_00850 [Cryptosporidium ubiquitum]OII72878.1 hypothetical protein cubi_00850 [Cryptosporidium ubiquitum]